MEWWGYLLFFVVGLLGLFALGMPVAFAFFLINICGVIFFMGGFDSLSQLVLSIYDSLATFVLSPVPMFILMGEILFHSKMAYKAMDVFDRLTGRLPGRLYLLAVLGGTTFAAMTGSGMANAAMLGSTLIPEMVNRGYNRTLSLGTIVGAGGIAIMIPPSSLAVILGSLAYIPIGKLLIGGILPGILMGLLFTAYVIMRCVLNPSLAPTYDLKPIPLSEKVIGFLKYVLPLGFAIFLVIGLIILGVATPSESASMGAFGMTILGLIYGGLNKTAIKNALLGTFRITVMVLTIIAMATGFSQLMSFTGAARGLVQFVLDLHLAPMLVLISMNVILLILGCLMEQVCIMIITIPLFMPIIKALGFDPLWFGILMLINMEIAVNSPPFGLILFVMKGVAPVGTTMTEVYEAAIPFVLLEVLALAIVMVFPAIGLWLPSLMK
jgi:tripartite ATP-independent transporter DctM subunit